MRFLLSLIWEGRVMGAMAGAPCETWSAVRALKNELNIRVVRDRDNPFALDGLTFKEAAEMKYEVRRDVQFTVPPGSAAILKMLPGYESFDPLHEVLRMLRCGFGLKDAPRLWHKVLREHLIGLGLRPLQSDAQVYVWHVPDVMLVV